MSREHQQESKNEQPNEKKQEKNNDANTLVFKWVNIVRFKEKITSLLFKTSKNKDFINAKILIRTNDYKLENGFVTVNAQLTVQGLKDLNMPANNSIKIIMEHKEKKGVEVKKAK